MVETRNKGKRAPVAHQHGAERGEPPDIVGALKPDVSDGEPKPHTAPPVAAQAVQSPVLDSFKTRAALRAAVEALLPMVQDPTSLLQPSPAISHAVRTAARALHDHCIRMMLAGATPGEKSGLLAALHGLPVQARPGLGTQPPGRLPVPQLCVDPAFDPEQIWVQLDAAAGAALRQARKLLARAELLGDDNQAGIRALIKPEHQAAIDGLAGEPMGGSDSEGGTEEGDDDELGPSGTMSDDDDADALAGSGDEEAGEGRGHDEYDSGDGDGSGGEDADGERLNSHAAKRWRHNDDDGGMLRPTEDRFLRLQQMEAFLRDSERRAARALEGFDDEDGSDERSGDDEDGDVDAMLQGGGDDLDGDDGSAAEGWRGGGQEDEEEEEGLRRLLHRTAKLRSKERAKGGEARYSDFFGPERGPVGSLPGVKGSPAAALLGSEEADEDEGQDEEAGDPAGALQRRTGSNHAAGPSSAQPMSAHQRRLLRMQEQIKELEAAALGEKAWQLGGEADAARRPLNSALEVDMDFDTTVRPPPEPTAEAMRDLESLIKRRIADHAFDDVVRVAPAPERKQRATLELNDSKAAKGLGEEYAEAFVRAKEGEDATAAAAEDTPVHQQIRSLFRVVMAKLDALSHFTFAPKPVVEELAVGADVPAVAMEEAVPLTVSAASMRLPGEVYKPEAGGAPKAEAELSKEERKQRRAKRKRRGKVANAEKEAAARARAAALGQALPVPDGAVAPLAGRKSAKALLAAKAAGGKKGAKRTAAAAAAAAGAANRKAFGNSAAVFAEIQRQSDATKAGKGKRALSAPDAAKPALHSAALKL